MRAMPIMLASLMLLAAIAAPQAARAEDRALGLRVYSNLYAVPDEGEFIGLQLAIVPYSGPEETVPYKAVTGANHAA